MRTKIGQHKDCNCYVCKQRLLKHDFYVTVYKGDEAYYFCADHLKDADIFQKEIENEGTEH